MPNRHWPMVGGTAMNIDMIRAAARRGAGQVRHTPLFVLTLY